MPRPHAAVTYSIDGGGSRTAVAVTRSDHGLDSWERESFAVASVGEAKSRSVLAQLLREIETLAGPDTTTLGCIASSSMPVREEAPRPAALLDVVLENAPPGTVVVVNDVVPLLWSQHLSGVGVVVCSGTGSSVIGRSASGALVKIGGHEHIVSDEGSAYSMAREALRAAARALDGTGPPTKLRDAAEAAFGRPVPALGRWLAELPRCRPTVASFAPAVLAQAQDGDEVAEALVRTELHALAHAVDVATKRLSFDARPAIGMAGGVLLGSGHARDVLGESLLALELTDRACSNLHLVDRHAAGTDYVRRFTTTAAPPPDGVVLEIGPRPV